MLLNLLYEFFLFHMPLLILPDFYDILLAHQKLHSVYRSYFPILKKNLFSFFNVAVSYFLTTFLPRVFFICPFNRIYPMQFSLNEFRVNIKCNRHLFHINAILSNMYDSIILRKAFFSCIMCND